MVVSDGEARALAERANAALAVHPGNAPALGRAIRRLRADSALRDRLVSAGVHFGRQNRRDGFVHTLADLLDEIAMTRACPRATLT